jgi:Flp pilus assembly protein TadD
VTDPDLDQALATGDALLRPESEAAAIAHFQRVVARWPDDPRAWFGLAGAFDYAGREAEAVEPYRRARDLGLDGDDLPRWYVQFGSTLRNLGQTDEAVAVLSEGAARFPDDASIRAFRALTLHSAGRYAAALVELLELLLRDPAATGLSRYRRALAAYTDDLRDG